VNLTTGAGAVTARYQYDAWGNKRSESGSSFNRFGFTGHEEDTETGLIYAKARYYDPDTARFLSQDSYLGESETPPSLHRYLYAYANPTVWIDPTGHFDAGPEFKMDPNTKWDPKTQTWETPDGKRYRPSWKGAVRNLRWGVMLLPLMIGGDSRDPNRPPPEWLAEEIKPKQSPVYDPNTREGRERFAEENPGVTDARVGTAPPAPKKKEDTRIIVEGHSGSTNGTVSIESPSQNNAPTKVGDADSDQNYERPSGSVRKQDYPTRERKPTRERLEEAATGTDGQIRCQGPDCAVEGGRVLAPGEGTVEHNPPLVQTHNEQGYNTDQETRNDLYNETATEIHCIDCQRRQGGQTKERYRRDVGPEYEPRQPRKKKE
jgi:RHS repeat-associated protein